jgi:galactoside O-acetyltransferase
MPAIIIGTGSAIGAMSFVRHTISEWEIYAGNPLKYIGSRSRKMVDYAFEIEHEL